MASRSITGQDAAQRAVLLKAGLSYGELLALTEGHATSIVYERILAALDAAVAEARREERDRWTGRLVEIGADLSDLIAATRMPDGPPASAPEHHIDPDGGCTDCERKAHGS